MDYQRLIGQVLGNWRLLQVVGVGGFGAVFEAEHVAIIGRRGAVKVLKTEMSTQSALKQRFLNEASAASRAEHENIVQIFDGGISPDGICYQVMELLQGTTLSKLILREGRLDTARAVNIAVQIAGALQAAHTLGIVHRDLKPDNVFLVHRVSNPEFVKVLDFGIAKLRDDQGGDGENKLTSTGMIIGTAAYMAPEQWQSRPDIDGRADVYSLGVMLYEMLCGRRPYEAQNAYEWIMLHNEATPPELHGFAGPPAVARVVRRMLQRIREQRPQTMREVTQDLRTACRGMRGIVALGADGGSPMAPVTQALAGSAGQDVGAPPYGGSPPVGVQGWQAPTGPQGGAPGGAMMPGSSAPGGTGYGAAVAPLHAMPTYAPVPQNGVSNLPAPLGSAMPSPLAPQAGGRKWTARLGEILLTVVVVIVYLVSTWSQSSGCMPAIFR